jgi:hypothetical protein
VIFNLTYFSNDENSLDTGRDTSARSLLDSSLFPRIVALPNWLITLLIVISIVSDITLSISLCIEVETFEVIDLRVSVSLVVIVWFAGIGNA